MDQIKIGQFIKAIRVKHNLTQKEFADILGVTFQAVSKWENGKNIPDISILKMICEKYDCDINEVLDGEKIKKKKKWKVFIIFGLITITLLLIIVYLFINRGFEFKRLASESLDFDIYGSIAYNNNKASIYISNIDYCGEEDGEMFNSIECYLYEDNGKQKNLIDNCIYLYDEEKTLDEAMKEISFNVDEYSKTCKIYDENLMLQIVGKTLDGKERLYTIPLKCS